MKKKFFEIGISDTKPRFFAIVSFPIFGQKKKKQGGGKPKKRGKGKFFLFVW